MQDSARIIVEQAERMTAIIRQLLDFSRRRGAEPRTSATCAPLAARTVELLAALAPQARRRARASRRPRGRCRSQIDPSQIQQVLTNLVVNGIQAMPRAAG